MYIAEVNNKKYKIDVEKKGEKFNLSIDGKKIEAEIIKTNTPSHFYLLIENKLYNVIIDNENTLSVDGELFDLKIEDERIVSLMGAKQATKVKEETPICVSMPGLVIDIEVKEGDKVKEGDRLLIVEAMKMQNEIKAPRDGTIKRVIAQKGKTVNSGETVVTIG
jgi:biotin carboxyl carrier protein